MVLFVQGVKEHGHGFSRCGGFIQQGSIGNGQGRKVTDHGLVIQQTFETSLADLRLVRGVLGIPSWIFKNIPEDHRGCNGIIIPLSDIGLE